MLALRAGLTLSPSILPQKPEFCYIPKPKREIISGKRYNITVIKKSAIIISFLFIIFIIFIVIIKTYYSSVAPPRSITSQTPLLSRLSQLSPISPIPPKTVSFIAVGDIMLGRYVNYKMIKENNWQYPFLKTGALTSSADIAFGNLEAPFVENCPTTTTGMIFCARKEAIEGLKFAGFDVLSLANNHILNYGHEGLEYTKKLLEENKILYSCPSYPSCSSNPSVISKNYLSFGFLAFNLLDQPLTITHDREQMSIFQLIKEEAKSVDVLIVSLHWGNEYQKQPTENQKKLAHEIIDTGAKIIIGHHPHVIQPIEEYNDSLIFYSLGNFVFDQPWSEETKKGEIAKIIFDGKNIESYETIPIYIKNLSQPYLIN